MGQLGITARASRDDCGLPFRMIRRQPPVLSQPRTAGIACSMPWALQQACCAKRGRPPSFRHFNPPQPASNIKPGCALHAPLPGTWRGGRACDKRRTGEPGGWAGGWTGCLSLYRTGTSGMQETAIADGVVANGFPLKGIGIRFKSAGPYKKMSSWGNAAGGCGEKRWKAY